MEQGRTVTFREGLETGGRPLGWLMAVSGVLMWLVWKNPAPHWDHVRMAATGVIALAWTVPTFVVKVPAAARSWQWAAVLAVLSMLLLR